MFAIGTLGGTNRTASSNISSVIVRQSCRVVLGLTTHVSCLNSRRKDMFCSLKDMMKTETTNSILVLGVLVERERKPYIQHIQIHRTLQNKL